MNNYASFNNNIDNSLKHKKVKNMTMDEIKKSSFLLTQEHTNYNNKSWAALRNLHTDNELNQMFFSQENINRIQKMIKVGVYNKTNKK